VQPCDEDEEKDDQFFFIFQSNGAPMELQGKTEVLGEENLSQCSYVHHKSHMD
jgi:hypothetical protein